MSVLEAIAELLKAADRAAEARHLLQQRGPLPPSQRGRDCAAGKGALPWVRDITRWSHVVHGLLRPGGFLYLYESHPLDWVWKPTAVSHEMDPSRSYFDEGPRPNEDFPAAAVRRYTPSGQQPPTAWEYHYTLGQIITATADAGLEIILLTEHHEHFWGRFPNIPSEDMLRLPHTFSLLARRASA